MEKNNPEIINTAEAKYIEIGNSFSSLSVTPSAVISPTP
jgi:hypothetical protein